MRQRELARTQKLAMDALKDYSSEVMKAIPEEFQPKTPLPNLNKDISTVKNSPRESLVAESSAKDMGSRPISNNVSTNEIF